MKHRLDSTPPGDDFKPAFEQPLHVGRPNLGDKNEILQSIEAILDRNWLTNHGPVVTEFENTVADYVGARHCIAMCNGTVALEIAIRALGLEGEVIIPSYTFVATAHALQWQGITPVFCDIEPHSCTIDPKEIERHITPRTTGIIGVHLWSRPCDTEALQKIADKHGLALMFDAAHAFGCSHEGAPIGGFGRAEVFSFHATKFFNTLEGGAVVTNDDELAQQMRLMKNFGFAGEDEVIYIGTNGKMNEASAAVGLSNFAHIGDFIEHNRKNYEAYRDNLTGIDGLRFMEFNDGDTSNYQYITIILDDSILAISRDGLHDILWNNNIRARRYFYPGCHRMEPYRSYFPHAHLLLPVTEQVARSTLCLPTGLAVTPEQIYTICNLIRASIEHPGQRG
ncbi:MAG: aminotransferase class I/II-fold pyridoxal phosphate-dependent enzyme [Candidatus Sumerlaeota bacterium]